ncbi:AbrB family transcriptional regulator, partial [Azoarcus sp. TTM-91]|uniref:AbrB family transcriptional regulator n=1 Tax=Azoarcus sp. TTM-91 TaxID=2691581 RepID=UPI00145FA23E
MKAAPPLPWWGGALALAFGLAGGGLLHAAAVPLGWMLGAMLTAAVASRADERIRLPKPLGEAALLVIGVLIGCSVTPAFLRQVVALWPVVVVVGLNTGLLLWLGNAYLRRRGGFDPVTAFFASMPGGLSEILAYGASLGGHPGMIATVHLVRFVFIIGGITLVAHWAAPAAGTPAVADGAALAGGSVADWLVLAGCALGGRWLARRLGMRMGLLLVPAVLSGLAHGSGFTDFVPPLWLIALCQVAIGCTSGLRLRRLEQVSGRGLLLASTAWSAMLFLITLAAALAAHAAFGWPLMTTLLALIPGGVTEVSVIALGLGADLALVMTAQLSRQILIMGFTQAGIARLVPAKG